MTYRQRSHDYLMTDRGHMITLSRSLRSPISILSLRWALVRAAKQRPSLSLSEGHQLPLVYVSIATNLHSIPGSCLTAGTICLGHVRRLYIVLVGSVNTCRDMSAVSVYDQLVSTVSAWDQLCQCVINWCQGSANQFIIALRDKILLACHDGWVCLEELDQVVDSYLAVVKSPGNSEWLKGNGTQLVFLLGLQRRF